VGAQQLYSTPVLSSHTLNMPKQCKRDEAHIRNFGHHEEATHLKSWRQRKYKAPRQFHLFSIQNYSKLNRITLIYCYFIYIYVLQFFSAHYNTSCKCGKQMSETQIHQSWKCHITWCPSILHEPYLISLNWKIPYQHCRKQHGLDNIYRWNVVRRESTRPDYALGVVIQSQRNSPQGG